MSRNKKSKRVNLPQETLERARAELRGEADARTAAELPEAPIMGVPVIGAPALSTSGGSPRPKQRTTPLTTTTPNRARRSGSATLATRRIPAIGELLSEYGYVMRDLRNLAILAAALLITILVASLLLSRSVG